MATIMQIIPAFGLMDGSGTAGKTICVWLIAIPHHIRTEGELGQNPGVQDKKGGQGHRARRHRAICLEAPISPGIASVNETPGMSAMQSKHGLPDRVRGTPVCVLAGPVITGGR
jgi:hypothetical protein